jgi:hypothetical protein
MLCFAINSLLIFPDMKTFLPKAFSFAIFFLYTVVVTAQCPATLTLTAGSITHAQCPDNGSVTLTGTGLGNSNVVYSIVSGPSRVGAQQSSNVFNSLAAGTYLFRATCLSSVVDLSVTINNLYTPINPNFPVAVTNVCTNYTPGGTISVLSVSGGRAPFQYSFIKNAASNYDDALSVYTNTNVFNAATWGTYQVRIKDACGVFVTKEINLQPTYPPATYGGANFNYDYKITNCDSIGLWFWMNNDDGEGVGLEDYPKLRFNIYEKTGPAAQCNKGALFKTIELTSASENYLIMPKRDMVIEIVTPCGDTRVNCFDYPDNDNLKTNWQPIVQGCGTGANPYTLSLRHQSNQYGKAPYTIRLYNNSTNVLLQTINNSNCSYECHNFNGLALGSYRIEITDACGKTVSAVYTSPTGAPGFAVVDGGTFVDQGCTFQNGKVTVRLGITGLVPNLDTATLVITSGPDNIGQSAKRNTSDGLFHFFNLTPDATYGFSMNTGCTVVNFSFRVPREPWRQVQFSMTPVVTQQCGGAGTIDAGFQYSGWGDVRTELWNSGVKISENNSGVYTNVSPGTYTIRSIAEQSWCSNQQSRTISETVTVLANGTAPQVLRQFGTICENGSGQLQSTGSVSLEVAGFAPFRYDVKRISPNPQATYTTRASGASGNYTLTGLDAYAVYNVLIIDNCGKSTTTEVVVGNTSALAFAGQFQPCTGSSYQISAPRIAGATYEWKKKNEAPVLSTTRDLFFGSYVAGYNGEYICTITIAGNCIKRTMNAVLNSSFCGYLLPVNFTSFSAFATDCKPQINWMVAEGKEGAFEVERSTDAIRFASVSKIEGKSSQFSYSVTDLFAPTGKVYYRIKFISKEGKFVYSDILSVTNNCTASVQGIEGIFPNPVVNNTANLIMQFADAQAVDVFVINASGQAIYQQKVFVSKGTGNYPVDVSSITPGLYYVKVQTGATVIGTTKLMKK